METEDVEADTYRKVIIHHSDIQYLYRLYVNSEVGITSSVLAKLSKKSRSRVHMALIP